MNMKGLRARDGELRRGGGGKGKLVHIHLLGVPEGEEKINR